MNAVTATNRRVVKAGGADFYPTPPWATKALLAYEDFLGRTWEPACGDGAISKVLVDHGMDVTSSDLFDYGYGSPNVDFLDTGVLRIFDHIITNPPFALAEAFVSRALQQSNHKVALLLRLAFLEGAGRYSRLFSEEPPARVWVFSERITMYPNGEQTGGTGTTAYAWFVWDKTRSGSSTKLGWISPGYKELHRISK